MHKLTALLLIIFGATLSFSADGASAGRVKPVTQTEAKSLVTGGKAVLVDVREKEETAEGMLSGAVALPLSGLQAGDPQATKTLEGLDKNKEVILYCRSGRRSAAAAELLAARGFKVRNLGGYSAAKAAGL